MGKPFKISAVKYLLPLLMIAAGVWLFTFLFERNIILGSTAGGAYKINRIINESHRDEIPIFGSSRAENNFIPGVLGREFFNYGIEGTGNNVMLFFLEEEMKKSKHAPVIINLDLEGSDSNLGNISYYVCNADYEPVKILLGKYYKPWYAIPLIKYSGSFGDYFNDYFNDKKDIKRKTDAGGRFDAYTVKEKEFNGLITRRMHMHTDFKNDSALETRLYHILETHPDREFIFVLSPYHWSYFASLGNVDVLRAYIRQLKTHKNARIINMSRMAYPDSLFINTKQLNYEGAKLFSNQLRDSLDVAGLLNVRGSN